MYASGSDCHGAVCVVIGPIRRHMHLLLTAAVVGVIITLVGRCFGAVSMLCCVVSVVVGTV